MKRLSSLILGNGNAWVCGSRLGKRRRVPESSEIADVRSPGAVWSVTPGKSGLEEAGVMSCAPGEPWRSATCSW
jgi:hypothetical protein